MLNLVLTLIAIALFVVVLTYGFNYIDINKTLENNKIEIIKVDLSKINFLITKYKLEEERNPSDFSDLVSKGYMRSTVETNGEITFLPSLEIKGLLWPQSNQISFSGGSLNICFGGDELSEGNFKILKRLNIKNERTLVAQEPGYTGDPQYENTETDNPNVVLASECFATTDEDIQDSGTGTFKVWATYKIEGNLL